MADVLQFTGQTTNRMDPEAVLEGAKAHDLEAVVVLGVRSDGSLHFASSHSDLAEVLLLLKRGELQIVAMVEQQAP